MSTHGIKVTKSGKAVSSSDIRDFILHSDYPMFKIHSIESASISIASGSTTNFVDITHNLGYKPAFLVYQDGQLLPKDLRCYVDGTKIRITRILDDPYNESTDIYAASDAFFEDSLASYYVIAGKKLTSSDGSAIRFPFVAIDQGQTVTSAGLEWRNVLTTVTDDIKFKIFGINEDNTADFSSSPMGRPKTTAVRTKVQAANTSEFNFGDDVTSLVQEIVNRGGWAAGNNMGFLFNDNGTNNGKVMASQISDFTLADILLTITLIGTGTLDSNYKVVIFKDPIAL